MENRKGQGNMELLPWGQLPANEMLPQNWTVFFWHVPLSCYVTVSRVPVQKKESQWLVYFAVITFTANRTHTEIFLSSGCRQCSDRGSGNGKQDNNSHLGNFLSFNTSMRKVKMS